MAEDEVLLRIEGLKTYFHTYEGVVKALEGIDIVVKQAETMGLVGETGCGKTVTALSVMRLIPSPPGKIEAGKVLFDEPSSVTVLRNEYDKKFKGAPENLKKKEIEKIERELGTIKTSDESRKKELKDKIAALTYSYDLLRKSQAQLNEIRGDSISMIFQEPLTALNPSYTIGEQIGETIELHQMEMLVEDILEQLRLEESTLKARKRAELVEKKKDAQGIKIEGTKQLKARRNEKSFCSLCGTPTRSDWKACMGCGARFSKLLPFPLISIRLRISSSYYRRLKDNPFNAWAAMVRSNIFTRRLQHRLKLAKTMRAEQALKEVKIAEPQLVVKNYPHELSGGMRQRAMIAMMMSCQPDLLIADEPTTALDVTVEAQILALMKELQRNKGTSILLITHDLGIIAETCHRVAIMYAGHVVELSSTESIFAQPMHPYTNALLRSIPKIGAKYLSERKKPLYVIPGAVPNLINPPEGCRFHPRCEHVLERCKSQVPALVELAPGHFVACHNPVIPSKEGGS
ncbi:MAG: ABC transporter ATP-binding protein [Thermoplasmata archaeon]|nr:ABC transporter ATP-binding protein [Thermoplasmata archaeon]